MVAAVAALFAFGGLPVLRSSPPDRESRAPFDEREVAANATGIDAVSVPARPNYNYSVIPGGARDAQELARAIQTDEVVADHYRDVDPSTMHPQKVSVERMAHVSYRINDRVFWTKKPVRIYEGETILTNGETEIRARCGNAISMAPLLPTSDDEPESTEFDALTDTGPMLVAFDLPFAGVPSALDQPFGDLAGDGLGLAPPVLPFGIGVGGYASGANHRQATEGIPEDVPQDIAIAPSSSCPPTSGANAATVNMHGERTGTLAEGDPCEVDFPELDSEINSAELAPPESNLMDSTRLDSIRLDSIPLGSIPLGSTLLRSTLLGSTPLGLIHLNSVPLCSSRCLAPNSPQLGSLRLTRLRFRNRRLSCCSGAASSVFSRGIGVRSRSKP
jgi:hypothetical protein